MVQNFVANLVNDIQSAIPIILNDHMSTLTDHVDIELFNNLIVN